MSSKTRIMTMITMMITMMTMTMMTMMISTGEGTRGNNKRR